MIKYKINDIEELNYNVCSFLLRNKVLTATIHCSERAILDSLSMYMIEIGIPFGNKNEGICLISNYNIEDDSKPHILITLNYELAIKNLESQNVIVFELHNLITEEINDLIRDFKTFDILRVPFHLQNQEIKKMFLQTFLISEEEIDIISPWMNGSVVNKALVSLMENAINRGVKIKIIYGLNSDDNEYNLMRSIRSDKIASLLVKKFSNHKDLFFIRRMNIHYKLVLCDEKYKLEGSYNYLSFTGDYEDETTRIEGSPFGRDLKEIRYLRKKYFADVGV